MISKKLVCPNESRNPPSTYSPGIIVESKKLLFISGQVAIDDEGKVVGKGDILAQARYIFKSLDAILEQAGSCFENVVKTNYYITDPSVWPKVVALRSEYFKPVYPASTMVVVKELVKKDLLLEIEAVAAV